MSEFDSKANDWDKNQIHLDRSKAIADAMLNMIDINHHMTALEFGAGTGLLSFELHNRFESITMIDNSQEMVRVTQEKIAAQGIHNMHVFYKDIEKDSIDKDFDVVYSQMVLHHVNDINHIISKLKNIIKPGGYLAIADLHTEDGSFHGANFDGHKGFDANELCNVLNNNGFSKSTFQTCFTLNKEIEDGSTKEFPIFLLVAQK